METSREQIVYDFVKESTKHFDSSHNHEHAWIVYQNALKIIKTVIEDYDHDLIMHAALLHDVCDHKYPQSIPRSALDAFIFE